MAKNESKKRIISNCFSLGGSHDQTELAGSRSAKGGGGQGRTWKEERKGEGERRRREKGSRNGKKEEAKGKREEDAKVVEEERHER